jgi:nitrite reductase/ring-hydroxylating ferredoxin subunit
MRHHAALQAPDVLDSAPAILIAGLERTSYSMEYIRSQYVMSEEFHRERMVPHVGTYRRELPVSIERLYENTIDWEHLPYLHRSSFARIEYADSGLWGFRARVWPQPYSNQRSILIELQLDRDLRRWITSTIDGPGTGTEVWTHAFSLAERRTLVVVDFFVPGLDESRRSDIGRFYANLYARLYDEDARMMSERQVHLDSIAASTEENTAPIVLGPLAEVRARLPLVVGCGRRKFCIVENRGELIAYSALCQHMLGPLEGATLKDGIIECPWHGYRYNILTRRCVSGADLSLTMAPQVRIDADSSVRLEFAEL